MTDPNLAGEGKFEPGDKDWKKNVYTGAGMPDAEAQRDAEYRSKFSLWDDLVLSIGLPLAIVGTLIGVVAFGWLLFTFIRGGLQALGN